MGLKSEKRQQNRGKLRSNKGDREGEIRDMTTEKCKNQGRKWHFWRRMTKIWDAEMQRIIPIKEEKQKIFFAKIRSVNWLTS